MSEDEGMDKYGVDVDKTKSKTAEQGIERICPICGQTLDNGGACPQHGTEPFESD